MPSLPWSKSNKSHSSVDSSSGHPSPVPSGNPSVNDASANRFSSPDAGQQQGAQRDNQQAPAQQLPAGVAQQAYRQQFPQRTTSTANRHSTHLSLDQNQSLQQQLPGSGQHSPGYDSPRRGSYQPQPTYAQEPKKGFRHRLGLTSHKEDDAAKQASKADKLPRRISVRKSDPRAHEYQQSQENGRLQAAAQWQGSSPHLATSNEQDEDNLDPFLQQEDSTTPQVPPKDVQYQAHPPQFSPNPHQGEYNRPPLARVDTEGSFNTQGGVDRYSPEHQGLPQQPQPPQQQYQSYHPAVQHPQNPNEYQAFHPQNAPSPLISTAQLHQQENSGQPQNYYPYQQQQGQQQSPQAPQDAQGQNVHYPQPPPSFTPQVQPHQGQDFQHVQHARGPSQAQGDPSAPPASHQIPQIVQGGQQIDGPQQQQLRPPSSQAQLAPPSPLQPSQPYQPYDAQQGQPQAADPHSQNTTPPQQGQNNMVPPSNNQRNTLRKVNEAGQTPSGAPSRESSLLQQPSAQGQAQGQPPVSPGIQTFGANVVPTASQGQPYRGEKQGQQPQGGEMGRATPPPRSANDMSDEEIAELTKELVVLREKYQKVKRYFFEQQAQVHQLQNSLANQRLSLSRTSWDDSEYGARFGRLDGLIAQLAFSIRKDWKSIPQMFQVVVNKNAVETGKQEMTAVGRAYISNWLVENIFDKYFHPDLEPKFSTQLKAVQNNIRRFASTSHTTEDEDALVAKVINWRLATLEGLADQLRSPQATTNRTSLTDSLNEQLIASLQMYLNEPAPPDLNGGVPMIVELAVSIAQHVPLESREVHIEYFPPGHGIVSEVMKLETGVPALTDPIREPDDTDRASLRSLASRNDDNGSIAEQEQQAQQAHQAQQTSQAPKEPADKKRSMFGFGGSKKTNQTPASLGKRESSLGQGGSQQSLSQAPSGSSGATREELPPPRVRMAAGFAVQIRGKSILMKAPVYST
ncbi:hypothetical protein K458DRAFT_389705 [Lentithecium fluviatile CBS 122367]|uniref:Uncharacterized protein n=1 Tax=Lentithecium fluviatile CBS 122367 TaxID=1168545 RepID=A0A6G1J0V6_9PLEO|nr:hypothetical protein K458DRAFT_389705 [Lentithecium fluviatile CBS 122367]